MRKRDLTRRRAAAENPAALARTASRQDLLEDGLPAGQSD